MTDYEAKILAAIKLDPKVYDTVRLRVDDFSGQQNRRIFRAMSALIERGDPPDDDLVAEMAHVEPGAVYALTCEHVLDAGFVAGQVKTAAKKRHLGKLGETLVGMSRNGAEVDDMLKQIDTTVMALTEDGGKYEHYSDELMIALAKTLEKRQAEGYELPGMATGFPSLDKMTGGLRKGELTVIAARTSVGKTALALTMITSICAEHEHRVALFSAEMNAHRVMARCAALAGRLPLAEMNEDRLMTKRTKARLPVVGEQWYHKRLYVNDTPGISLTDLRAIARVQQRRGAEAVFVDYLTLVRHGDTNINRAERVGQVSKSLQHLARELDLPVVVLSQLNREAVGHRPGLENLRQSGEVEEDSDMILLIDRNGDDGDENLGEATLIVAKNRNGPTGDVPLIFMKKTTRFENKERNAE